MEKCTQTGVDVHDCRYCQGEACNLCGAGCWNSRERNCEHDVVQRHEGVCIPKKAAVEKILKQIEKQNEREREKERKEREEAGREHVVGKCVVCDGIIKEHKSIEHTRLGPAIYGPGSRGQMSHGVVLHGYYCIDCGIKYQHPPKKGKKR